MVVVDSSTAVLAINPEEILAQAVDVEVLMGQEEVVVPVKLLKFKF